MSATNYLTIDGVPGTSANPGYSNAIEILSYSLGGEARSPHVGTGDSHKGGSHELYLVKAVDSASPVLAQAASTGRPFKNAVLKAVSSSGSLVMMLTMTDVVVTSYQMSGGGDSPAEMFTLSYSSAERLHGAVPSSNTTVKADHQHLINHLQFLSAGPGTD